MYKIFRSGVQRLADGAVIPPDPKNRQWREYLAWTAAGGVPGPEFTQEELDAQAARDAAKAKKAQDIADALPAWADVEAAVEAADTAAKLRVIVKKLARVVYWLAKDKDS